MIERYVIVSQLYGIESLQIFKIGQKKHLVSSIKHFTGYFLEGQSKSLKHGFAGKNSNKTAEKCHEQSGSYAFITYICNDESNTSARQLENIIKITRYLPGGFEKRV